MGLLTQTLVFPLTNRSARQVFDYETSTAQIRFMYDTGARVPVWCSDESFLTVAYPDAYRTAMVGRVSGFGKGTENSLVYCIPRFVLSDGIREFVIKDLLVAVLFKPQIGCDFLISETMFSKTDTFTFRRKKKELHILAENKEFHCTAKSADNELLDIAVWSQNV